ncbi:unnamed protein product [Rotaria sp. Silwood2]|nr:unnamed protein product [Rotaria sp. Silwood2]CAF4573516.1 unnamed protein product [Rotaria sp. Silwood2]
MEVLVDTGATNSIIQQASLSQIQHQQFYPVQQQFFLANKTSISIIGYVTLEIKIQHIRTYVTAVVTKTLCCDVILGEDWIKYYQVTINRFKDRIEILGNKTVVPLRASSSNQLFDVKNLQEHILVNQSVPSSSIIKDNKNYCMDYDNLYYKNYRVHPGNQYCKNYHINHDNRYYKSHKSIPNQHVPKILPCVNTINNSTTRKVHNTRLRASKLKEKPSSSSSNINEAAISASSVRTSINSTSSPSNILGKVPSVYNGFSIRKLKEEQMKDFEIQEKIKYLVNNEAYDIIDGIIYKLVPRGKTKIKLPWIPKSMINQVLLLHQDHHTTVHLGTNKTSHKLMNKYYWPNMYNTITNYMQADRKPNQYYDQVKQARKLILNDAELNIEHQTKSAKSLYDQNRPDLKYIKDDLVLVRVINRTSKFQNKYEGSYRIIEQKGPSTFIIKIEDPDSDHNPNYTKQMTISDMKPIFIREQCE